jgi:transcriptional regulator with XRE-family HTH domain
MLVDAEKIRAMRLKSGWTQEQLAEMCDVSVRTIQRIEKTGIASLETTNALAAVLEQERQAILVQDGVRPATSEISLKRVVVIALLTFALGLVIGAVV